MDSQIGPLDARTGVMEGRVTIQVTDGALAPRWDLTPKQAMTLGVYLMLAGQSLYAKELSIALMRAFEIAVNSDIFEAAKIMKEEQDG